MQATLPVVGAALFLVTLIGCSANRGPTDVTTIVFDGDEQTFDGDVTCTLQPDGRLILLASGEDRRTVRVLLSREGRLVVEKVGLHVPGATGFVDDPGQVWATKVDDTYTIDGRMPPNAGETRWHQFTVDIICRNEAPVPYRPPRSPYIP